MATKQHDLYPVDVWAKWHKPLGAKPTNEQLATVHNFARPGKQALVLAMALRADGVTATQMMQSSMLFDGRATYHRNKLKAQHTGPGAPFDGGLADGAYRLKLNKVGVAFIERNAEGAAAKATGEGKAKAATPAKPKAKKPTSRPRKPVQGPPVITVAPAADGDATAQQG